MRENLHIISFDGLSRVDMDFLKERDNFKRLLEDASYSFEVESVYPTLTYPAHTSIVTGNNPNIHGVVNNTFIQPFRKSPDWYWFSKFIKTKTFQELATENSYRVMSIFWPVTGGMKIKYNMPEIFPNRPWKNQLMVSLSSGTKAFQLDGFFKFSKELRGISQPYLDNFTHKSYIHSLKRYRPDVSMVHYTDLDASRHKFGFSSKEAEEALLRLDQRLGDILDTIEENYKKEFTNIVLLGDHSSKDADKCIFINRIFEKMGLLETKDKNIVSYDLIAKDAGGSCYIYGNLEIEFEELRDLIEENLGPGAIKKYYRPEEAEELGADGTCKMMLEAGPGYLFESQVSRDPIMTTEELKATNLIYHINNHGYSPTLTKNYETVFIAKGNKIKKSINIGRMKLIDEGPTFAKILGLDLGNVEGRVLEEILQGE